MRFSAWVGTVCAIVGTVFYLTTEHYDLGGVLWMFAAVWGIITKIEERLDRLEERTP